jgi:SHS family lactate transporter-like MFS transporter
MPMNPSDAPLSPAHTHVDNSNTSLDHVPTARAKDQLETWHSNRNNKSFLRAMIPTWHVPPAGEEATTKNPIKLLGMVSPFAWLMFFSVSP